MLLQNNIAQVEIRGGHPKNVFGEKYCLTLRHFDTHRRVSVKEASKNISSAPAQWP